MSPTPATLMGMDAVKDRSMVAKRANVTDVFVGQKIRTYRTTLGLSQTELAQRLGLTFQQVQKYERGINRVGAGRLYDLAGIFDVPVQALFPEKTDGTTRGSDKERDVQLASQFLASSEGRRLCQAFLKIGDTKVRKHIVALAEQLSETK
jgi:transcriptional regulator with XRE-family HTH domain